LLRQAGDDPFEFRQHAVDPGAGGAAFREDIDDLEEDADRGLVAAETTRLQQTEDAGAAEIVDRFG
jgi:hypothetical protein